jgi:hypothetical protein
VNETGFRTFEGNPEEHTSRHLLGGWADALAYELDSGVAAGRGRRLLPAELLEPARVERRRSPRDRRPHRRDRAVLTPDHPEEMTANVSERIFLIDWSWFFENEDKVARQIDLWSAIRHATATGRTTSTSPRRVDGRQLVIERNSFRYASAAQFHDSTKARAVRFEPRMKAADLRRGWVGQRYRALGRGPPVLGPGAPRSGAAVPRRQLRRAHHRGRHARVRGRGSASTPIGAVRRRWRSGASGWSATA